MWVIVAFVRYSFIRSRLPTFLQHSRPPRLKAFTQALAKRDLFATFRSVYPQLSVTCLCFDIPVFDLRTVCVRARALPPPMLVCDLTTGLSFPFRRSIVISGAACQEDDFIPVFGERCAEGLIKVAVVFCSRFCCCCCCCRC